MLSLRRLMRVLSITLCIAILISSASAGSRKKKNQDASSEEGNSFSYYVLALSWAPDFCALPSGNKDPRECGAGRRIGFVVHGLWPQGETERGPEKCGPARPVSDQIVNSTLRYVPSESLIQHEWANHGTCSGLSAADYFATLRKARDLVKIPEGFQSPGRQQELSPSQLEARFAETNPSFPKEAFRVSCVRGQLQEARVCFTKELSPRACTESVGACGIGKMLVLPVQ